jgi:hypothetical protein
MIFFFFACELSWTFCRLECLFLIFLLTNLTKYVILNMAHQVLANHGYCVVFVHKSVQILHNVCAILVFLQKMI